MLLTLFTQFYLATAKLPPRRYNITPWKITIFVVHHLLCFNYHESDCCLSKSSGCQERGRGRVGDASLLITDFFFYHWAFQPYCRGIYMNSKQADNEDVSEDTTLIILITGRLDWGRRQHNINSLSSWKHLSHYSVEKNKPCMHINRIFVQSSVGHGGGQPPYCMCGPPGEMCQ